MQYIKWINKQISLIGTKPGLIYPKRILFYKKTTQILFLFVDIVDNFPASLVPPVTSRVDADDPAEDEVDKLVSWTENLPNNFE